ncbi:hypothetical protein P9112_009074 [Eukaryota sp. TZLM1-RC]
MDTLTKLNDALERTPRIAFFCDPLHTLSVTDTTLALMKAFHTHGYEVYVFHKDELFVSPSHRAVCCSTKQIVVTSDPSNMYSFVSDRTTYPLTYFDIIFIRTMPPVDAGYLHDLQLLSLAKQQGCFVVNDPDSMLRNNEKLSVLKFPELSLPTIVSRNKAELLEFFSKYSNRSIILKPVDLFGGSGVFLLKENDPNVEVVIDLLSNNGINFIVGQPFEEKVKTLGDTRILLINGKIFPFALQRLPPQGSIRSNIACGGKGGLVELSEEEKQVAEEVRAWTKEEGLLFVGIDVIGGKLSELNNTCPYFPIKKCEDELKSNISKFIVEEFSKELIKRII